MRRGQGATEYLVLLAVVLLIGLVAIALLGWFPGTSNDAKMTESQSYWRAARPVAVLESKAGVGGMEMSVQNLESNNIVLTGFQVKRTTGTWDDFPFEGQPITLSGGEKKTVIVDFTQPPTLADCTPGSSASYTIGIKYSTKDGNNGVEIGTAQLMTTCSGETICVSGVGCGTGYTCDPSNCASPQICCNNVCCASGVNSCSGSGGSCGSTSCSAPDVTCGSNCCSSPEFCCDAVSGQCSLGGTCIHSSCINDGDCVSSPQTPHCSHATCVCTTTPDSCQTVDPNTECVGEQCVASAGCFSNLDCTDPTMPHCDVPSGTCQCTVSPNSCGAGQVCDPSQGYICVGVPACGVLPNVCEVGDDCSCNGCEGSHLPCDGSHHCQAGACVPDSSCVDVARQPCIPASPTQDCCAGMQCAISVTGDTCCITAGSSKKCSGNSANCCTGLTCDGTDHCSVPTPICKHLNQDCDLNKPNDCCASENLICDSNSAHSTYKKCIANVVTCYPVQSCASQPSCDCTANECSCTPDSKYCDASKGDCEACKKEGDGCSSNAQCCQAPNLYCDMASVPNKCKATGSCDAGKWCSDQPLCTCPNCLCPVGDDCVNGACILSAPTCAYPGEACPGGVSDCCDSADRGCMKLGGSSNVCCIAKNKPCSSSDPNGYCCSGFTCKDSGSGYTCAG